MAVDRLAKDRSSPMHAHEDLVLRLDGQVRERVRREGVDPQREALVVRRIAEDVVSATGQSASEAATTAHVAQEARRIAGQCAEAVSGVTEAMGSVRDASTGATAAIRSLGETSAEIGSIVDTITRIAGQTNLLALNAAIEAGELGEGDRGKIEAALAGVDEVLGVLDPAAWKEGEGETDAGEAEEIERLVREREEARRTRDFAAADRLRNESERFDRWLIFMVAAVVILTVAQIAGHKLLRLGLAGAGTAVWIVSAVLAWSGS